MANKVTITKGIGLVRARVEVTTYYGDSTTAALTETQTLAMIYDLVQTLPQDNPLRKRLEA